jgi:kelch-like protein 10
MDMLKFLHDLTITKQQDEDAPTPEFARPRIPHEILFVLGGNMGVSYKYIDTYDHRTDRWVLSCAGCVKPWRIFYGTAVIGFNIYVIGGRLRECQTNSCLCFNAVKKTWSEMSPMHESRVGPSVVSLGGLVYAIGGMDGIDHLNTAERYDYQTNRWSMIGPMNERRGSACAAVLNGKIYITGACKDGNSAEVYDPEVDQWTLIAKMTFPRFSAGCVAYHGYVYTMGGSTGRKSISSGEKYNPTTNAWTPIPDMCKRRDNFAIGVIDDKIYAIGGRNGDTVLSAVEYYDEESNKWFEASDMFAEVSFPSACVITGLPNANDYCYKNGRYDAWTT